MGSSLVQDDCKEANTTQGCKEVLLSTHVIGDYSFVYYVGAVGGSTHLTKSEIILTVCKVYMESSQQRDFIFLKSKKDSGGRELVTYDYDKFSTSDELKCHILKFEFEDTTAKSPGLYRDNCTDSGTSEDCRTVLVPTDTARL